MKSLIIGMSSLLGVPRFPVGCFGKGLWCESLFSLSWLLLLSGGLTISVGFLVSRVAAWSKDCLIDSSWPSIWSNWKGVGAALEEKSGLIFSLGWHDC